MVNESFLEAVLKNADKFWLLAQIDMIMFDIIELKQENRSIGDKIKSLYGNMGANALKLLDCSETAGYTYNDRVIRDHKTIEYLEKLQKINSKLIMIHRSEIKELRDKIQKGVV